MSGGLAEPAGPPRSVQAAILPLAFAVATPAQDQSAAANAVRVANRDFIVGAVQRRLETEPTRHWQDILSRAGVPNAPIQDMGKLMDDPQLAALGLIQDGPSGALPTVGLPLSFGGVRPPFTRRAPQFGEHTDEIFAETIG